MKITRLLHTPDPAIKLPRNRPPRLLIVQIAGIGDLVLATPAMSALRDKFSESRIDLVTTPRSADLLAGHPSINDIYEFDISRFSNPVNLLTPWSLGDLWRQVLPLRKNSYDVLLSLNNISTTRGSLTLGLLFKTLNIPVWVGRNTDRRAWYFDRELAEHRSDPVPEAITKLKTVALIGANPAPRALALPLTSGERRAASERLSGKGDWAGILPGANVPAKSWPVEKFAEVSNHLISKGFNVVLLGGQGDMAAGEKLESKVNCSVTNLIGQLNLSETAAVLQQLRIIVTNDTGPMHMAAAMGTQLVAIYGPSNSFRYRPWTEGKRYRILHKRLECNPCDYYECPMAQWCMDLISTQQVIEQINDLIN